MKIRLIVIFSMLFFTSCIYVDLNDHYVDVSGTEYPEISIKSNLPQHDSIVFGDSLLFSFEISVDTSVFLACEIFFGSFFYQEEKTFDSIWLSPTMVESFGNHDLELYAYTKSTSGSLADILEAEYVLSDTSWIITIYSEDQE